MSNALIPYSFTPGTKAKAQEVNANFKALADKIEENNSTTVHQNSNAKVSGQLTFTQPIFSTVKQQTTGGNLVISGISDNETIDLINAQNDKELLSGSFRITNGDGFNEASITVANEDGTEVNQLGIRNTNGTSYAFAPTFTTDYNDKSDKIVTTEYLANHWSDKAPTDITTATRTRPQVVVENYISETSGYRIWSDGFIEQWGRNRATTTTFLKPFTTENYCIQVTSLDNTTNANYFNLAINKRTLNDFAIFHTGTGSKNFSWIACGY